MFTKFDVIRQVEEDERYEQYLREYEDDHENDEDDSELEAMLDDLEDSLIECHICQRYGSGACEGELC